jgi:outer membrane protein TolC
MKPAWNRATAVLLAMCTALLSTAAVAQTTATGTAAPPVTFRLRDLVDALDRDNPELKAFRRDIDMAVARIRPAGTLPDPMLSAGYMSGVLRPPFFPSSATPGAFREFALSQEIPFPGKLRTQTAVAVSEVDVTRWTYEDRRAQLAAELKSMYLDYRLADRSLAIVRRNKMVLEQMQRIAEARFAVGQGLQQDVLKAQLEVSMLIEQVTMLERERTAMQARINGMLYREPGAPVDPDLMIETTPLPGDLPALRAMAEQRAPMLKREERQIMRSEQILSLARKEILPDFAVNVTTQQPVGGMPWMYGIDFMVKLPLFWERKQRPMIAEAAAGLDASRRMRDSTRAMTVAAVDEQYAAVISSERLLALYRQSLLPQARLAFESSIAAYQVGNLDFLALLSNFTAILTYELGLEEQTARHEQALTRLEPLVGTPLVQ